MENTQENDRFEKAIGFMGVFIPYVLLTDYGQCQIPLLRGPKASNQRRANPARMAVAEAAASQAKLCVLVFGVVTRCALKCGLGFRAYGLYVLLHKPSCYDQLALRRQGLAS